MHDNLYQFGMIGLGVMGSNLLLNMADHGIRVIGYDINAGKTTQLEASARTGTIVKGTADLQELVQQLERPRRIMMLVPAGKPVDAVINDITPLLEAGDILIDGGNSYFVDTQRRTRDLAAGNIHFIGMGVSGGEQGARLGPSMMPGGDQTAWQSIRPFLELVVAKVNNEPCIDYMGMDAAGHYVKMIHNGIEYSIMQLISETYQLLHEGCGMNNDTLHEIFSTWDRDELQSFLIEITAAIFLEPDTKSAGRLLDVILDRAGAKGTGKWASQDALNLGVPVPSIDAAVTARNISALKDERSAASALYKRKLKPLKVDVKKFSQQLKDALYASMLISYGQGFALLQHASTAYNMKIPLPKVVRVWRGGCIIRSALLETFIGVFDKDPALSNILLNKNIARLLKSRERNFRSIVTLAVKNGYPVAGFANSLGYLDAYRTARLPANLIQAQRDYFGAHTYERLDEAGVFHTSWGEQS